MYYLSAELVMGGGYVQCQFLLTAMVSFTISRSYTNLTGKAKDEDLKELWRDFVIEKG